jgi:hypothetical protein
MGDSQCAVRGPFIFSAVRTHSAETMIENAGTVRISWVLNALPQLVPASKYVGDWYLDFLVKNIGIRSADH